VTDERPNPPPARGDAGIGGTFDLDVEREVPDAVPAATVILVRDGDDGLETLMLRRNSKLAFAGGHWVFPGGRVDDDDLEPSADEALEGEVPDQDQRTLQAARRAAVREAAEEADLLVEVDSLVPFAHWTPPPVAIKRFATWFFLAPAPTGDVTVDMGEIHEHQWVRPADALRKRDEGEIELSPPTWCTLDRLAASATVADAIADATDAEVEHFETHIARADEGGAVAMWHGDAGYESGDPDLPGPRHRLWMVPGPWRFERWDEPPDASAATPDRSTPDHPTPED
jgi:8-oxo-dGTP pyrophosphatase MutT (NUDIX family)